MPHLSYVLRSIWNEPSNQGQRLRRVMCFFRWQLWKRVVGTPLTARLFNGLQIRVWPDCDTAPSALYYALPNSRHISLLRNCLHGGTFIDVGANVGLVTLLVADKIGHAILFEPHPLTAKRAQENLRLNQLSYELMPVALSDTVGNIEFENSGASSCNRTVEGFMSSVPTITVGRTSFDHFWQERSTPSARVDAVKIDVEGHENSVLRGMKEFLRQQRPAIVMFEYLERTDISQALSTFDEVGFTVFELSPSGARRVTPGAVRPLQDLFACPKERAAEFGI